MMTWILILALSSGHSSSLTNTPFTSFAACERAATRFSNAMANGRDRHQKVTYVCVPNGDETRADADANK